jgi:hypothetical protein
MFFLKSTKRNDVRGTGLGSVKCISCFLLSQRFCSLFPRSPISTLDNTAQTIAIIEFLTFEIDSLNFLSCDLNTIKLFARIRPLHTARIQNHQLDSYSISERGLEVYISVFRLFWARNKSGKITQFPSFPPCKTASF